MGGYGALKLALKQPDKFGGAVGISSVADIKDWFNFNLIKSGLWKETGLMR